MTQHPKIYVAGHRGMVGSAIVRQLLAQGHPADRIVTRTHAELDLTEQTDVRDFFETEKPDQVYLAAAKVGGINANNTYPAEFIYQNLMVQSNIIDAAFRNGIQKLLFLGSSCIYPKLAPQPNASVHVMNLPQAIYTQHTTPMLSHINVGYGHDVTIAQVVGYIVQGIKRRASSFNIQRVDHIYQDPHVDNANFKLHYGDLSDTRNLIRIVQETQPDEIYNLGAQSHVALSFESPEYTADVDAIGTMRLLEAIRILGLEKETVFTKPAQPSCMARCKKPRRKKLLPSILGKPMFQHVFEQTLQVDGATDILVATDTILVAKAVGNPRNLE